MVQSAKQSSQFDLIKTIDENADVQDFSEDSDAEVEVKLTKLKTCICNHTFINSSYFQLVSTDQSKAQEEGRVQQ